MPPGAAGLSSPSSCAGLSRPGRKGSPGQGGRFGRRDGTRAGRRALLHREQGQVGFGRPERGVRSRPHGPCSPQPLQQGCSWKRFSPFDKIVFCFLFIFFPPPPENAPLKPVQGTTEVPGSRAVPRQPPSLAEGQLPPPLPRPPRSGAVSILPAGSWCDAGRRPPPPPPRGSPSGSVPLGVTHCPVPSLFPGPSLASPLQRGQSRPGGLWGGTCGARWDQRARDL